MRTAHGIGVAMLAVAAAACVSGSGDVQVRAIGNAPGRGGSSMAGQVAEGRAQLALGNVGLALEQFRKALRQQPASVDSLVGIARCYDAMGRTDLSRRYYEEALAIAPGDTGTLGALAESLARQGRADEARRVRQEIALRSQMPGSTVSWTIDDQRVAAPPGEGAAASVTVELPSARPAPAAPPPQPVHQLPSAEAPPVKQVRLERLSLGEVALVTAPRSYWTSPTGMKHAAAAALDPRPNRVRLLNAARREGLAARSRDRLTQVGWRSVSIGDAPRTRPRSIVYYPIGRRPAAQRLAASLRIAAVQPAARTDMLVMLGRDLGG